MSRFTLLYFILLSVMDAVNRLKSEVGKMGAVTNTVSILVWHCTLLNADDLLLDGVGFFLLRGRCDLEGGRAN